MSVSSDIISGVTLTTFTQSVGSETTVTYFDTRSGIAEEVGQKITDGSTGEEVLSVKLKQDDGGFIETTSYKESSSAAAETFTYNYDYNDTFTGGTEVIDGVTRTINSDFSIASEAADVGNLTLVSDTAGIAAGAIASSGNIYKKENDYGGGNKEITYFDANGAITGYEYSYSYTDSSGTSSGSSFQNKDGEYVGDKFSDPFFSGSNFYTSNSDGGFTETGSFVEKDPTDTSRVLFSNEYNFTYDSSGNLASGTETLDSGETITYGANWSVTGISQDLSNLDTSSAPSDIPSSFVFGGNVYTTSETLPWGDTEVTYYNASGAVVGRANTYSGSYSNVNYSGTTYYDEEYNWIGDKYTDGTWSSQIFVTDNGNGTSTEVGSESDGSGWSRSWVFVFNDNDGSLASGSETVNGITTTFGANWEETGRSADISGLSTLEPTPGTTGQAQLDALPASFVLTNSSDSSEYALYKLITNPWGNETTYFNANGEIVGYAYSYDDPYSSGTSYSDANYNYLGDTYTDKQSGYTYTRLETQNTDGTFTEVGSETDSSGTLIRSWTFKFDSSYNLVEGTETRDGITTKFGENWAFIGETADVSNLTAISDLSQTIAGETKLNDLYDFAATVDGAVVTAGYIKEENHYYGDGKEITYFNAAGEIVGRVDSFSFEETASGQSGGFSSSGKVYMDANWNFIGDMFTDTFDGQTFSRSNFNEPTLTDGVADGGRRETGSESETDSSGTVVYSRSWTFEFDANDNLESGTEKDNNGLEITYGANWEITGRKADTSNLTRLTDAAELSKLPSSFVLNDGSDYALYSEQSYGTYDKERTFFDANGETVGYAYSYGQANYSGTSYNDANYNYLGDTFTDQFGTYTRFETQNTDGTRTEVGSETNSSGDLVRSWTYKFDSNYNLVEGTETREDGTIVSLGANWVIIGETFDTSKLAGNELDINSKIVSQSVYDKLTADQELTYAELFDFSNDGTGNTASTVGYAVVENYEWGGSQTVYYNAAGNVVGRAHANEMYLDAQDQIPIFEFFRLDTTDGGWIDFYGVGVDHLTGYDGKAIAIPLGRDNGSIPETVEAMTAALSPGFEMKEIAEDRDYGPNKPDWLLDLTDTTVTNGEASITTNGFIISNPESDTPTIESVVSITATSSDSLEYYYSWENQEAIFVNTLSGTEVTVDGQNVFATFTQNLTDNPPQSIYFEDPDYNYIANVELGTDRVHYRHEKDDPNSTGYIETGLDVDGYGSNNWEFKFDANGAFLGGTETRDGITSEVNQFGQTTSQTVDTSNLLTNTNVSGLPPSFIIDPDTNVTGDEYVKYLSQSYPGGQEVFYFTDSGTSLGRSMSWSDTYGNTSASGTDYFNASDEFIGSTYSEGTYTSTRFDSVDATTGVRTETGSETRDGTVERQWEFNFDENFNLISGSETRSDGTTTTYGADWTILSQSVDMSSLTAMTSNDFASEVVRFDSNATDVDSGLVKLSDIYDFSVAGQTGLSGFYKKDEYDWGDGYELSYFNSSGEKIGMKMVDIFVESGDTMGSAMISTGAGYGGMDQSASTAEDPTTFVVTVEGGKYLINGVSQDSITFIEGKTYTFDLSDSDLGGHPFAFSETANGTRGGGVEFTQGVTSNGVAQGQAGAKLEVTLSADAPDTLYYYCSNHINMGADVSITDATIGIQYYDKDWNWKGDSYDDGNSSRSYVRVEKDDGSAVEVSVDQNRKSLFTYDSSGVFEGGTEIDNGLTFTITANYERQGGTMDTSALAALEVTGAVLDDLPASFTFDDNGTTTAYRDLSYEGYGGEKEYSYFNASGEKIGHTYEFTDSWSGEKVTDFMDNDYNWLGNVRVIQDQSKSVFSRSEDTTANTTTETNVRYNWDGSAWVVFENSTFVFDSNFDLVSGTEIRDGITTTYGANWSIEASSADVSALTDITSTLSAHLGNSDVALEDIYNFAADVSGTLTTAGYKSEQAFTDYYTGGNNVDTTYYNAAGEEIGSSFAYSDSYGSGANFYDNDQSWLGDFNSSGSWSSSFFTVQNTNGTSTEYRVEQDTGFLRKTVENFDANGVFTGGSQEENGLTSQITLDNNGFRVVSAAALDPSALSGLALTGTAIEDIPDSFIFEVSGTDTAYRKLTRDDSAYQGGKEYTYFDESGAEIGTAYEAFDSWMQETRTSFNDANYNYLGSVSVKTDDYKNIDFSEFMPKADVTVTLPTDAPTDVFVETRIEYNWDTSTSAWVEDSSEIAVYTDRTYDGGTLITRVRTEDGQTFTFDDTGAITGSAFTGDVSSLQPLNNDLMISALPTQWSSLGTIKASYETLPSTGAWHIEQYYTYYVDPLGGDNYEIIGYANFKGNLEDPNDPSSEIAESQLEFKDKDETTVIGSASENSTSANSYYYTPGATPGSYTYTNKTMEFGAQEELTNYFQTIDNYINGTSTASGAYYSQSAGTYNGGSYTAYGKTEYYDASGTIINTNFAPVGTIDSFSLNTASENNTSAAYYAGQVTEDDGISPTATGSINTSDQDGDTVSLSLINVLPSGGNYVKAGDFGTLTLGSSGTYSYTLDNSNVQDLNTGDFEHDNFIVEVKDADPNDPTKAIHTSYVELEFEIKGVSEPVATGVITWGDHHAYPEYYDILNAPAIDMTNTYPGSSVQYEWFKVDEAGNETSIQIGTNATYQITNVDDIGHYIKVSASYFDMGNNPVTLGFPQTDYVVGGALSANYEGVSPVIAGYSTNQPEVGNTLEITGFSDPDGIDVSTLKFKWYHNVEGDAPTLITTTTTPYYTLTASDLGQMIDAKVLYEDNAGSYEENYASKMTAKVVSAGQGNSSTHPEIISFSSTNANGTYDSTATIFITATASEPLLQYSSIFVTLDTGDVVELSTNNSGESILSGNYNVDANDASADLSVVSYSNVGPYSGGLYSASTGLSLQSFDIPAGQNLSDNKNITIEGTDNSAPFIVELNTDSAPGTYSAGDTIILTATVSETVKAGSSFTVTLSTGEQVPLSTSSSGTVLQGEYIVQPNISSPNLTVIGFVLGTVEDTANNLMVSTDLPEGNNLGDNAAIVIDTDSTPPTIVSFSSSTADGSYGTGQNINISATMSEPVKAGSSFTITLSTGAEILLSTSSSGTELQGVYQVQAGDSSTDLTVSSFVTGDVKDLSNNAMLPGDPPVANNLGNSKSIVIDTTIPDTAAPIVTSFDSATSDGSYKPGDIVNIKANMSEVVQAESSFTVTLSTTDTVVLTTSADSSVLTGNYTISAGDNVSDLTIDSYVVGDVKDLANNQMSSDTIPSGENLGDNRDIVVDSTPPLLSRFDSPTGNGVFKAGNQITIAANMNEQVQIGSKITVTLSTGATVQLTAAANGTILEGIYTVSSGDSSTDLRVSGFIIDDVKDLAGNVMASNAIPSGGNLDDVKDIVIDDSNGFSVDLSGASDISFSAMNWSAEANMTLASEGSGYALTANELTVDRTIVRENVNGMSSANPFSISVDLDKVAKFDSAKNENITVTVRDLNDESPDNTRDAGEREVSATIAVRADGDGTNGYVKAVAGGSTNVNFTRSNDTTASVSLNNTDEDLLSISSGTLNSPSSLNLKIASLLEDIGNYVNVDMLSTVGRYEYEISGLGDLLEETDSGSDVAVESIKGTIKVVDDQALTPNIDGITLSFDTDGNSGTSGTSNFDLVLQDVNYDGDSYISIALASGDTISAQQVNDLDTPGIAFAPNITIDLGSAIDTGTSSINQDVRIEIVEIEAVGQNTNYLTGYTAGKRKIELDFELNREGDGSKETWSSIANDTVLVKVWGQEPASTSAEATFSITNGDVDTFVAPVSTNGSTPGSLDIKLQELLDKVNDKVSTPTASIGDDFAITVSFLNNSNEEDIILSGEFTLS